MENLLVLTAFTGGSPTAYREVRETSPPPPAIESMKPANPTRKVRMTTIGILTLVTEICPGQILKCVDILNQSYL